ncbi:MAG: GNAT family N-acetyltransferase [Anaerolineae bacterium]|jgi:RimJ/RimL family protein N-acetyltransferase|nr:GNAT family N-acetyltransferase [Anaerolineae bacterium]
MTDRETFTHVVYGNWAEWFHCPTEEFRLPGTVVIPDAEFAGSGAIHIWTIGRRAFARLDPAVEAEVVGALGERVGNTAVTEDHLRAALAPGRIDRAEDSVLRYLYPPDHLPAYPPKHFIIRAVTADDADALSEMKATCTPDEVEMGEVSVEDEIGFGCFASPFAADGPRMAAIATGFRLTGFMDIGVLTSPAYRRRGLGKAVVSALCTWCHELPIIAQYRCLLANPGSYAISQALGFNRTFTQQSIYLRMSDVTTEDR